MTVLVVAEHNCQVLDPATLKMVQAAGEIDTDIHLLVAGKNIKRVVDDATTAPTVSKVLVADNDAYEYQLAENMALLIVEISGAYSHILSSSGSKGKEYMPRVAALLGVEQISEMIEVVSPDTFRRPVYAGNAIATIKSLSAITVMTVRASGFAAVQGKAGPAEVEYVSYCKDAQLSRFVSDRISHSERPELNAARVIVSGGRGLQDKENFALLNQLADKLDAAVGASRAAVDAGFAGNELQVGQTGKIVAPELYIAVGISGAIQHLAGMKDAKVIVAINIDPEAPIFSVADYGLTADLFAVLPELESKL